MIKLIRWTKVLVSFENCKKFSHVTAYWQFINCSKTSLDYADVIYDQPSNASFSKKFESVQYYAALATTGAIKGSSRENLYQELGVEYLCRRRWARRLSLLYTVFLKLKSSSFKKQKRIRNTKTITSEKQFLCKIINFCIGTLRVPWRSLIGPGR